MKPPLNPLGPQHLEKLNAVLEAAPMMIEYAKACKDCGIPTDEYVSGLEAFRDQARAIKARFFPNEP